MIEVCHSNQPYKSKLSLYNRYYRFSIPFNSYTQAARRKASIIRVGVVCVCIRVLKCLKQELGLGYR